MPEEPWDDYYPFHCEPTVEHGWLDDNVWRSYVVYPFGLNGKAVETEKGIN